MLRLLPITVVLGVLASPQWAQSPGNRAALFNGDTLASSRPLSDLADVLQARYEKPIAYEDPVWEWKGDEERRDVGRDSGRESMLAVVPVHRVFRLPPELTTARPPELTAGVLEKIVTEYHRQNPGLRFRVVQSKYGLHIVPETAYDASGRLGTARAVMETIITVEEGTRTASGHFEAICEAVSRAQVVRVTPSVVGIGEDWYENLFAAPGGTLTWGATAVTARDALADLLSRSATSFSWRLLCSPISAPPGIRGGCTMNLRPIQVARVDANGNPALVRLQYDRRKQ